MNWEREETREGGVSIHMGDRNKGAQVKHNKGRSSQVKAQKKIIYMSDQKIPKFIVLTKKMFQKVQVNPKPLMW